jgi:hypothetical protein
MTTRHPTPAGRTAPRKQKPCHLPRPVDGGLLQAPNQPDPWADPGLLAYPDPADCDTPAAPQTPGHAQVTFGSAAPQRAALYRPPNPRRPRGGAAQSLCLRRPPDD